VIAREGIEGAAERKIRRLDDYVLTFRNSQAGGIEARARDAKDTEGVRQAKAMPQAPARWPIPTNGPRIYQLAMENRRRLVRTVATPETNSGRGCSAKPNAWQGSFVGDSVSTKRKLDDCRYISAKRGRNVLEAIGRRPKSILDAATGTGKTSIAFQISGRTVSGALEPQQ